MVSTLDSPCNDPGSIPGPGGAAWIWVYYPCGSATSSARDVKQGCRLCAHAFKIMHGRKRTWMTKRKSRGPETNRYPACREHPYLGRIVKMLTVAEYNQEEEEEA